MILGLTGSYCSGKDTVADYLVNKKGFLHFSLSDELRKELASKNIELTRENLIKYGTNLRKTKGNAVLAEMVLKHIPDDKNSIVTSIRHSSEIEKLKTNKNFLLVNVDAPIALRFERMKKRNRPGDPDTFEKFVELEKRESQTEGSGQQLKICSEMASSNFINDTKSLEDLYKKIDSFLQSLK
ncbi:AAA family ATPase [Elusimicrobiota bacterium]